MEWNGWQFGRDGFGAPFARNNWPEEGSNRDEDLTILGYDIGNTTTLGAEFSAIEVTLYPHRETVYPALAQVEVFYDQPEWVEISDLPALLKFMALIGSIAGPAIATEQAKEEYEHAFGLSHRPDSCGVCRHQAAMGERRTGPRP